MLQKTGADLGPVELPSTLRPNFKRNYIPQNHHLDGYAQMPRSLCPPYTNSKAELINDASRMQRSHRTNKIVINRFRSIENAGVHEH